MAALASSIRHVAQSAPSDRARGDTYASLVIWKHAEPDPVKCGNLLWCISNTKTILEVLAMKDGGTFVRLTLETKNMDRQTSKTALGSDLLSAKDSQIGMVINNLLRKQSGYKLVECECIKRALSSGVFGVLQREAASYLPHPELASTAAPRKAVAATNDTDSEEEREIARDIKASQRHEAARMAEAKSAKSGRSAKGKGKVVVQEIQKKKPSVPSQAPREKLLGSSFVAAAAETGRNSRESKTDSLKWKRESLVTPPPPPKVPVTETSESSEDEENIASDKEKSEESDSGTDSPLPSQPVNKKP
ncbi:hypothetical protein R1sor_017863 [Riccia sorocarpa]|uniref:Uncharacterized protein n=1 Tax=Riccia sorocarpa TaxID=122646 RepID=A0ABD3I959_9MARC